MIERGRRGRGGGKRERGGVRRGGEKEREREKTCEKREIKGRRVFYNMCAR